MEECRTEASIGIEYSDSIDGSSQDENTNSTSVKTNGQVDGCTPSQRRKRKRISPHSTPKVAEGRFKVFEEFFSFVNTNSHVHRAHYSINKDCTFCHLPNHDLCRCY